ncbi:unnamed protein product [Trichobilharzia szidati]|nr:unnamed protein product [Trichobilharzia szidati]
MSSNFTLANMIIPSVKAPFMCIISKLRLQMWLLSVSLISTQVLIPLRSTEDSDMETNNRAKVQEYWSD